MRALAPPNVALIKRLEAWSREAPAAYRSRVGLLSTAGNLALTIITLLPLALPVVVVMLMVSNPLLHVVAALSLLLFLWIMRPSHDETGHVLTHTQAPALYAAVDELRAKLKVSQEMQLVLDDEFNAGALEMPGLLGGMGTKRTLYLGIPLLCALSRDELLAVIGHELGHFSHRHGPMGQRIYRARAGWLAYAQGVDERDSALDKGAAAFAHMFVPYFNSYSFVYGRQCEYEADADAAGAVGAATAAQALARTEVAGRLWLDEFERELGKLQRELPEPPANLLERFTDFVRGQSAADLERRLQAALARPSDWLDTHPCLAERIGALQQQPLLAPADGPCAGAALLGAQWPALLETFNREWHARIASEWALAHARQRHLAALLALPEGAPELHAWPLDDRLARAELLAAHHPEQAADELRAVLRDHAGHPGACYALGVLTLKTEPDSAVALLESAAKQDHGFRVPTYRRLEQHLRRQGDAQGAYNFARRLELARKKRGRQLDLFAREIDLGQFLPSTLPAGSAALLHEARKADPCVLGGWLITRDPAAPPAPPNPYGEEPAGPWLGGHAVILTVDADQMQAAKLQEDELASRYATCLRGISAPNVIATARVIYASEAFAPELRRALAALPAATLI